MNMQFDKKQQSIENIFMILKFYNIFCMSYYLNFNNLYFQI